MAWVSLSRAFSTLAEAALDASVLAMPSIHSPNASLVAGFTSSHGSKHLILNAIAVLLHTGCKSESILCVVLKQGVGPCRTLSFHICAIRSRWSRTAIDGGTTGGIGHDHLVTVELGNQLDIGCFTTSGAGS